MSKQEKTSSVRKSNKKIRENSKIRSSAFQEREQRIPQINNKPIPLHCLYQHQRRAQKQSFDTQPGLQFWGCSTPHIVKRPRRIAQVPTRATCSSFSLSEHLMTKYLRRQASLSTSKRNKWFDEFSTKTNNVTPAPENKFVCETIAKGFSIKRRKTGKTSASSVATVEDENCDFNNRMLQQLAVTQNNLYNERVQRRRVTTERRRRNP